MANKQIKSIKFPGLENTYIINDLPDNAGQFQQLVTDGAGNTKWEDRPFYTGDTVYNEVVPETTATLEEEDDGLYACTFDISSVPEVGSTCVIKWNEMEYSSVAYEFKSIVLVGDLSFITGNDPTGEPFGMVFASSGYLYAFDATSAGETRTFSVSSMVTDIHKIDEKYLPTIPAEKLPTIPAEKLPTIPIPIVELSGTFTGSIDQSVQPSYVVKNLSYTELLELFNSGNFMLKDSSTFINPIKFYVSSSGSLFFSILVYGANSSGLVFADLVCSKNSTSFYRNNYWKISATRG